MGIKTLMSIENMQTCHNTAVFLFTNPQSRWTEVAQATPVSPENELARTSSQLGATSTEQSAVPVGLGWAPSLHGERKQHFLSRSHALHVLCDLLPGDSIWSILFVFPTPSVNLFTLSVPWPSNRLQCLSLYTQHKKAPLHLQTRHYKCCSRAIPFLPSAW